MSEARAAAPPSMLLSGAIPPLADFYGERPETGLALQGGVRPGEVVVLTDDGYPAASAHGGSGKTQLAVAFSHGLWRARAAEALIWITATGRPAIVAGFARAAAAVGACEQDADAESAADRFASWLARTRCRWALVIDNLADPADLTGRWPAGPAGQVVITTGLPPDAFTTGPPAAGAATPALRICPVGGFSPREALMYLSSRLTDHLDQRIEGLDLAADLDGLPLAIAQAAAVITVQGLDCRAFRAQLADRLRHLAGAAVSGLTPAALATWTLAAECADRLAPARLAWPVLALAAMLDPHGIPGPVLTSPAACGYATGQPAAASDSAQAPIRAAVANLARVALISVDAASPARTVRMHPSVRAAVQAYLPPADRAQAARAAADALSQAWPDPCADPQLDLAFRNCAEALMAGEGGAEALWQPEAHPLLLRAGRSLEDSRMLGPAVAYWDGILATSIRLLGSGHADTLTARERLGRAYESAGRPAEAMGAFAETLAVRERALGPGHPDTLAARGLLAHACASAGRPAEAAALYERTAAEAGRHLGPAHPVTLGARADLAAAYQAAGRSRDAIAAYQMLLADSERLLGARHRLTLTARDSLAAAYLADGQVKKAIGQYQQVLADTEAASGPVHPATIGARANLASAYRRSGRAKDAIALYQRVLADREQAAGADHPDTIAARANLAFAYRSAGQVRDAIPAYERVLADRERIQGKDHAEARAARASLAAAYRQAGRLGEAIREYERLLADSERMLGPGAPGTLTARGSLAATCFADGRLMQAVALLRRALADSERYLGPDHPMTRTIRDNLDAATRA